MASFEEKLIIEVEKYRVLYDLSDKSYYDTSMKENAWQEIGDRLQTEADVCKKKWQGLRECFRKSKLRRKTVSGQAGKEVKPWKYDLTMSFLNRCSEPRDQLSNLSSPAQDEEDSCSEESMVIRDNVSDDVSAIDTVDESPLESPSVSGTSSVQAKKQKKSISSAAEVLQDYLKKKEERRSKKHSKEDHIREFFKASESVFRRLPEEDQVDARVEITQLLANYEKRALLKRVPPPPPFLPPSETYTEHENCTFTNI